MCSAPHVYNSPCMPDSIDIVNSEPDAIQGIWFPIVILYFGKYNEIHLEDYIIRQRDKQPTGCFITLNLCEVVSWTEVR